MRKIGGGMAPWLHVCKKSHLLKFAGGETLPELGCFDRRLL